MTRTQVISLALCVSTALLPAIPAAADTNGDSASSAVTRLQLPISGTIASGGTFTGTFTLNRFAARDGRVMAIGIVRGTATSAVGVSLGTALAGPVELPVTVGPHSQSATEAVAQQQQTCNVLHLDLGATNLDALGLQVTTMPIGIDLTGTGQGTDVLGRLICLVLETVGNVLGLVNLLNQILGLLGGLAGGMAG
jgi:hypothetical protein